MTILDSSDILFNMKKQNIFTNFSIQCKHISKQLSVILISTILAFTIIGCGDELVINEEDFILLSDSTNTGITVGSSFEDFANAYSKYPTQLLDSNGEWKPFEYPAQENYVSTKNDCSLMISTFCIDGVPTSTQVLMEQTGLDAVALNDYLASPEYLSSHKVVFRYIVFVFDDGIISALDDNYLDYNNEL